MKKISSVLGTLLLGVALVAAPTTAALADGGATEELVTTTMTEVTPVEENTEPERLAICHSGGGVNWTFIAPDASGYNGHQHHDADIYGLSEAECLAKNVVEEEEEEPVVDQTPFILIAWPMASWIDDTTPTWPQGIAAGLAAPFTLDLATRNLDALDAVLNALIVPCETSVQYQVDGNFDTAPVRSTIAGGSLYGSNNPAEALWGGGWGEAYKLVKIDGPECEEPKVVHLTPGAFIDTCSTGEEGDHGYSVALPGLLEGVTFGEEGGDIDGVNYVYISAIVQPGYVIAPPGEGDTYELTEYGARWSFTYTDELCDPPVTMTECEATTNTEFTSLAGWTLDDGNDDVSTIEIIEGGLHIETAAEGHRKAAGYWPADFPLSSLGEFVLDWDGTAPAPGGQLVVSLDGDAVPEGTLVIESLYGGIQWLSVPAGGTWVVRADSPHTAGGGGYPNQGTLNEWLALNPDARVLATGFSLGSGITGSGTIERISTGACATGTFDLPPVVVEPEFVTPLSPTFDEFCSVDRDAVNVPEDTDAYYYELDDQRVDGVGVVTVDVFANEGYAFGEETVTSWSHDFTNEACPTTVTETPAPPKGGLAETGSEIDGPLAIGSLLLFLGLAFASARGVRLLIDRRTK